MELEELAAAVAAIRQKPLLLVCNTPGGIRAGVTLEECARNGWRYLHIDADELDELLVKALRA